MPGQVIYGSLTPSSLILDDVYIAVLPPSPVLGRSTTGYNGGAPGCASWGVKNVPLFAGTPQDLFAMFGPPINSGYDLVQEGSLFLKQRPQGGFYGVRVTDGTDTAATGNLQDITPANALVLTGRYTGTFGNTIRITLTPGSNSTVAVPTWKAIIQLGSLVPEVFDRIIQGTAGAVWVNIASAINNVSTGSKIVAAVLPGTPSILGPAAAGSSVSLAGGTDGVTTITSSVSLGVDGAQGARTGMYALRGTTGTIDAVWLCGNSDSTVWTSVAAFARSVKGVGYGATAKGLTVAAAIQAKLGAGLDDPYYVLTKDYVTFLDSFLNLQVSIPPSCVTAGIACALSPEQSPGNKQAAGIIGTEATLGANPQPYALGDLAALEGAGINVITNPIVAGNSFGLRHGKNTSSAFSTSEIPYARKTNDLVRTMAASLGQFVNLLQTTDPNDPLRAQVTSALNGLLGPQKGKQIDSFNVRCDVTNNPSTQVKLGLLVADVVVAYLSVVDKFIVNLTAGQTVDVVSTNPQQLGR